MRDVGENKIGYCVHIVDIISQLSLQSLTFAGPNPIENERQHFNSRR